MAGSSLTVYAPCAQLTFLRTGGRILRKGHAGPWSFSALDYPGEVRVSEYVEDVQKYATNVDEAVVGKIVKYCGIALRNKDSSLVSTSDTEELERVKKGFATKKLELSAADADTAIAAAAARMKGVKNKSRVTFYYLMAEEAKAMGKFA